MIYVNYIHTLTCLYHVNVHVLYVSHSFYCAKVCLSSTVVRCLSHGTWRFAKIFKLRSPKGYKSERKRASLYLCISFCLVKQKHLLRDIKSACLLLNRNYPFIHLSSFIRFSSGAIQFRQNLPSTCRFLIFSDSLVGGFNPSEKYASQNENLPRVGMKIKNIWNHHLVQPSLVSTKGHGDPQTSNLSHHFRWKSNIWDFPTP